jgi:hypothetical protein
MCHRSAEREGLHLLLGWTRLRLSHGKTVVSFQAALKYGDVLCTALCNVKVDIDGHISTKDSPHTP